MKKRSFVSILMTVLVMVLLSTTAMAKDKNTAVVKDLSARTGLTGDQVRNALHAFTWMVGKSLKGPGDRISLVGFGSWTVKKRKSNRSAVIVFEPDLPMVEAGAYRYLQNYWADIAFQLADIFREYDIVKGDTGDMFFASLSLYMDALADSTDAIRSDAKALVGIIGKDDKGLGTIVSEHLNSALSVVIKNIPDEKLAQVIRERAQKLIKLAGTGLNVLASRQSKAFLDPDAPNLGLTDKELKRFLKKAKLDRKTGIVFLQALGNYVVKSLALSGDKISLVGFGSFSVQKRNARTHSKVVENSESDEITISAKKVVKFRPGSELSNSIK